jgi:hypothetical protein
MVYFFPNVFVHIILKLGNLPQIIRIKFGKLVGIVTIEFLMIE